MKRKHFVRGIIGFAAGYVLYKSMTVSVLLMVVFTTYSFFNKKEERRMEREVLSERFLVFLTCLEPLLKTAGTLSGFFTDATLDYRYIYGRDNLSIILASAAKGFRMNGETTEVLTEMATKLDIEDAYLFARSVTICESVGGNMIEVTRKTAELLSGKIQMYREISTILSGKRMEQKIISVMPIFLIGLLSVVSKAYLEPVYETTTGRLVMTAAGMMFLAEWYFCKKICDIKV